MTNNKIHNHSSLSYAPKKYSICFFSFILTRQNHHNKAVPNGLVVWGWVLLTGKAPNPESRKGFGASIIRLCCGCAGWYEPNGLGGLFWCRTIAPVWGPATNGSLDSNGLGAGDPNTGCWDALYAPSSYKLLSVSESNPPPCSHNYWLQNEFCSPKIELNNLTYTCQNGKLN